MVNLLDEGSPPDDDGGFTIETLTKKVRDNLLAPIRLLRTTNFEYMNVEEGNLADAYFVNDTEKNYAFLWVAYSTSNIELLQHLRREGADVNFTDPGENLNALHLSAFHGSIECVQWLLKESCRIVYTSDNLSPLHFAALSNSRSICQHLIEDGCPIDSTVLHIAVKANSLDCIQYLLQLRISVNEYDKSGMTALHIASEMGNEEVIRVLLSDDRIDVNAKTKAEKYTALHLAAECGYDACLRLLLENGAYVYALSSLKQTPLFLACKETYVDCVDVLLEYGAEVNAQDNGRRTPLHAAVSRTIIPMQIHVVRRLVDQGADVHLANDFGFTALHLAALNELDACVEYLILNGANVAATTKGQVTALNIIYRKTPTATDKIRERLDLSLAYNQEQLLKFSFRDIIRNSTVGEVGYLYTLQKEGEAKVLEHPLCKAFLHLKWQTVRTFILLRVCISLLTVALLSSLIPWGMTEPECYREQLAPILGICKCKSSTYAENVTSFPGLTQEQCWNTTFSASQPLLNVDIEDCVRKNCQSITLTTSPYLDSNATTWLFTVSCYNELERISTRTACSATGGIMNRFFRSYPWVLPSVWIFIMLMLVLNTIRVIFTFAAYKSAKHFFVNYSNIVEVFVTVCIPLTLINMCSITMSGVNLGFIEKSLASLTVLSSWAYLMLMVSQLPSIGTYLAMFKKVLIEFVKMKIAFLCILMGFTFTFCTLKTEQFHNPVLGFAKIMAMMTGELNFDDLFQGVDKVHVGESDKFLEFYTTAFVSVVFMIIITIVLMNLLVGIAVNDVDALRKNADLCKLIQQTKLINFLEETCFEGHFPAYTRDIFKKLLYIWPDSYTGVVMYVRPLSHNENRLPRDIMDAGLEIALDRLRKKKLKTMDKKPSLEAQIDSLEKQAVKLQELVCTLQGAVENIARSDRRSNSNSIDEATDYGNEA